MAGIIVGGNGGNLEDLPPEVKEALEELFGPPPTPEEIEKAQAQGQTLQSFFYVLEAFGHVLNCPNHGPYEPAFQQRLEGAFERAKILAEPPQEQSEAAIDNAIDAMAAFLEEEGTALYQELLALEGLA